MTGDARGDCIAILIDPIAGSLAFLEKTMPTKQPDGLALYLDGLRKAGLE